MKKLAKEGLIRICRSLGISSKTFGPVKGRHATARDYLQKAGAKHATIHPFRAAHSSKADLPGVGHGEIHERFFSPHIHDHPETFLLEMRPGRVLSGTGFIVGIDDMLIDDVSALNFGKTRPEPQPYPILHSLRLPACRRCVGRMAVITTNNTHNYFHWLTDALPRVEILRQVQPETFHGIDHWLVPKSNPLVTFTMERLGIPEKKLVWADARTHWETPHLLVPSPPGITGSVPPWAAEFLRREFLSAGVDRGFSRRVFVSRAGGASRRILNEAEVMSFLGKRGFQAYRLEEMSFEEQIGLFRSAEMIVSPHGAGLTNLLWARPGVRVLEIFSPNYVNVCYWLTAGRVGARYAYLCGRGVLPPSGTDPHLIQDNIEVDVKALEGALGLLD